MNKLPVMSTVSQAYGFLLGDVSTIVRIAWLPLLIAAALSFYIGGQALDAWLAANGNMDIAMQSAQGNFLVSIVAFLANVMVLVALLQVVMYGDRKTGAPFYLWFGMTEIRLVITYLLLLVAVIAAVIGAGIAFGILAVIAAAAKGLEAIVGIVAIALMIAAIWVMLKLTIVPAVVVAEKSLGVERAWALMRGNALRMFLIVLMTFLPVGVVAVLLTFLILGSDLPPFPDFASFKPGPENQEAMRVLTEKWQADFYVALRKHWMEFSVLNFVSSIVSSALFAGVAGNAYLSLAGEPQRE